jgi:hypothetical protein
MSLSLANNNTVFRAMSLGHKYKNIIYDPMNSLLDHILYLTQDNFYIVDNLKTQISDNVAYIPNEHIEFYNYHLIMSNSLEKHLDNNFAYIMHLPVLFLIEYIKGYKKEDRHLIQDRMKNHTKIFLNELTYNYFKSSNSVFIQMGIPLELFKKTQDWATRKNVCIFDYGPQSKFMKAQIEKEGIDCDIINTIMPTTSIVNLLNSYKICIDISENYKINLLCAAACGCKSLTIDTSRSIENIVNGCNQEDITKYINTYINSNQNDSNAEQFIIENYSFNKFLEKIKQQINNISHEAYKI